MAAIALGGRGVHLFRSLSLLLFVFIGLPHTDGTCTNILSTDEPIVRMVYTMAELLSGPRHGTLAVMNETGHVYSSSQSMALQLSVEVELNPGPRTDMCLPACKHGGHDLLLPLCGLVSRRMRQHHRRKRTWGVVGSGL